MARAAQVMSRLEEEKELLERYFYPETFPILRESEEPYFEREVKFKNGYVYKLRICITEGYPDVLPDLVVSQSPEDQSMPSSPLWSGSHITHTWPRRADGLLRICYFHPVCWTPDKNIYQVFKKGIKWLKVYVLKHLVRRKPMNFYLKEMEPTEEEWMKEAERRRVQDGLRLQAILNNPTPSPDELFVHPIGHALMSAFAASLNLDEKIIQEGCRHFIENVLPRMEEAERKRVQAGPRAISNDPTSSPDELFVDPFGHEFMSAFAAHLNLDKP